MTFILPFLLGLILVPVSRMISFKYGIVSPKRLDRWGDREPVPRFAGPAILLSALMFIDPWKAAVLAGFCLVGSLDDILSFNPAMKSILMLFPGIAAAWVTGSVYAGILCWCLANCYNLLDHADGLAGCVAFVALIFSGNSAGLALAGASAAFLVFNFPPARTFMGDSGSLTLGAAVVLFGFKHHGTTGVLLINLVPVLDTLFVIFHRLAEGRRPWIGGSDHTGHILLRHGMHPAAVPVLYGCLTLVLALIVR